MWFFHFEADEMMINRLITFTLESDVLSYVFRVIDFLEESLHKFGTEIVSYRCHEH